jgi:trimeric autotransporter adhesin
MQTPVPIGRLQAATDSRVSHSRTLLARPVLAWQAIALAALLSLALAGALFGVSFYRGRGAARPEASPIANRGVSRLVALSSLPTAAQGPISEALGAKSSAYRVRSSPTSFEAVNPAQHLRVSFGRSGVTLRSGALEEGLSLRAVGLGRSLVGVGDLSRSAAANQVRYTRRGLTEWYVNGPLGLEQGFTLAQAPSAGLGALTLSMAVSGDAHVTIAAGGESATLSLAGAGSLRYDGLVATDARGRALHSWVEPHSDCCFAWTRVARATRCE